MSNINTPSKMKTFFNKYPNSSVVYFDEDENTYLGNFYETALKTAKESGKRLFKTTSTLVTELVYPTRFLYSTTTNGESIEGIYLNNQSQAPIENDEASIAAAIDKVLTLANVKALLVEVFKVDKGFEIRVVTSEDDLAIKIEYTDSDEDELILTQKFL